MFWHDHCSESVSKVLGPAFSTTFREAIENERCELLLETMKNNLDACRQLPKWILDIFQNSVHSEIESVAPTPAPGTGTLLSEHTGQPLQRTELH